MIWANLSLFLLLINFSSPYLHPMYSPLFIPPLYFVKRGNLLLISVLHPLFARQRGGLGVSSCGFIKGAWGLVHGVEYGIIAKYEHLLPF
jgi:hypothetical protein